MVKFALIYYNINSYGVRSLVSYLEEYTNAKIKLILFPVHPGKEFSDSVVNQVVEECSGFDIVGFSVATNWYICSNQLAAALKDKLGTKVIFGGIHPTTYPEHCFEHVDAVCVGEGEEAMAELINRYENERIIAYDIKNIYLKDKEGGIIKNDVRPLIQDLDKLPPPRVLETEERIFHKGSFKDATANLYKLYMSSSYMTLATRGCVFHCAYCCNSALQRIYKGQKFSVGEAGTIYLQNCTTQD